MHHKGESMSRGSSKWESTAHAEAIWRIQPKCSCCKKPYIWERPDLAGNVLSIKGLQSRIDFPLHEGQIFFLSWQILLTRENSSPGLVVGVSVVPGISSQLCKRLADCISHPHYCEKGLYSILSLKIKPLQPHYWDIFIRKAILCWYSVAH